ncbi:hypothetical protein BUALT_Bualt14G0119100 [Buddleja alternifolia]|uniref:FAD-binding PCMH-type domain-containing protein n=1 Tax=Buddleja alternifolia TaxID=168488 RepID=A0AAV6WRK6_9LAMI|nr:hypothetical protein BUALT_Bualt14G0119100 [Buddleja alternifolia]
MEFIVYALFHLFLASLFVLSNCSQHSDILSSCLIDNKVYNFSLHDRDPAFYSKFLDSSIRNLRFAGPAVPKPVANVITESRDQLVSSVLCCKTGSFEIRVRNGGHSYEATSYVAYEGTPFVLIDIMNLNRVSIDLEAETAWVEAGATLGQTYYAISEPSKIHGFRGGVCPTVGMGGHVSGGGFRLLFRKYGLPADNVVDALQIDANGRPGTKDEVAKLVHVWQNVAPKLVDDFYLSLVVGTEMETSRISSTFKGLYLGTRNIALSILENAFPELNMSAEDYKEMSWIESVLYFLGLESGSVISNLKDRYLFEAPYYKAKSDYVRFPISITGITSAVEILEKEPKGFIILDPYGGAMTNISSESIPYPHRKGNLFMIQYVIEWRDDENEKSEDYMDWMRGFYAAMAPYVSSGPRAAYINYMDFDNGVMDFENCSRSRVDEAVENARVWEKLENLSYIVSILTSTKMAYKEDLIRIGREGFALVDEYIGKKGRPSAPKKPMQTCQYQYQPQQAHVYQVKPVSANEKMMNSYEVVQFRDGVSVLDYSKRKSSTMAY